MTQNTNWKRKIALGACAAAVSAMAATPAFAATVGADGGTAEVPIHATVVKATDTDVISVVMPAQIPLNIYLDDAGKLDTGANKTQPVTVQVQNQGASTKDVKVSLDKVTDTAGLMAQVKLALNGKDLSQAGSLGAELAGPIAPGFSGDLTLTPSAANTSPDAPALNLNSQYTVSTVLKASAV